MSSRLTLPVPSLTLLFDKPYGINRHADHSHEIIAMATHNVVLPAPLEQSVDNLVSSGLYQNRSEVIRAGLRLLLEREAMEAAKLEALRNAVASGLMQLETGDYDEVQPDELEDYLEQLGNSAGNH